MPEFSDKSSSKFRSIQGEQQHQQQLDLFMPQEDVDTYVRESDDKVVECRERGRHPFETIRSSQMRFEGETEEGFLVRRQVCPCCGLAVRVEHWDVRHHRGRVTRCELVMARTEYRTERLKDGTVRRYVAPAGRGRIRPRQIRNTVGTMALSGMSYTELIREVRMPKRDQG